MKRLGKGLAELIQPVGSATSSFVLLGTDQIRPGRFQPRSAIDNGALDELKASIRRSGIIEPVIVRPLAHGTYELVAGERRWRAAHALGVQEVPAIIRTLSDKEALEFSLVENIQRENLNPVEEAQGYARLLNEFGYTQDDIATAVGKPRATVANLLRVLTLPEEIRKGLQDATITLGHAKAILAVEGREQQLALYRQIASGMTVRQTEALASVSSPGKRRRKAQRTDPDARALEERLRQALGTKVSVASRKHGGRILIDYFSQEDLGRILQLLGVTS